MIRKIDFFEKLFKKAECRVDIIDFLVEEKLLTPPQKTEILTSDPRTHPRQIAFLLHEFEGNESIQLLDYEWKILPVEGMKLTIVTSSNKREWKTGKI